MKKILICLSLSFLAACPLLAQATRGTTGLAQTTKGTTGVVVSHHQAVAANSNPKMFAVPLVADTEVIKDAPKSYQMNATISFPAISNGESSSEYANRVGILINNKIVELKSQALFEFAESTDADAILSPMFSIKTTESTGTSTTVTVKVKGYAVRYTNFRPMKSEDYTVVESARLIDNDDLISNSSSKVSTTETVKTIQH